MELVGQIRILLDNVDEPTKSPSVVYQQWAGFLDTMMLASLLSAICLCTCIVFTEDGNLM